MSCELAQALGRVRCISAPVSGGYLASPPACALHCLGAPNPLIELLPPRARDEQVRLVSAGHPSFITAQRPSATGVTASVLSVPYPASSKPLMVPYSGLGDSAQPAIELPRWAAPPHEAAMASFIFPAAHPPAAAAPPAPTDAQTSAVGDVHSHARLGPPNTQLAEALHRVSALAVTDGSDGPAAADFCEQRGRLARTGSETCHSDDEEAGWSQGADGQHAAALFQR
jgi:hypothetical protein